MAEVALEQIGDGEGRPRRNLQFTPSPSLTAGKRRSSSTSSPSSTSST